MNVASKPDIKSLYSKYSENLETYIMFRIAQRVLDLTDELKAKDRAPIKMSIGAPTSPPPKAIQDRFIALMEEPSIHMYSVPKGEPFFRQAVSDRMKSRFDVDVCPNTQVCCLIGSKEGLAHMFQGLITPQMDKKDRDIILTPDPGYASYKDAIEVRGGLSYPISLTPENNYMPDLEDTIKALEADGYDAKKIKALIINYPSNPIGAITNIDYYKKVIEFARARNILVISDIAYADMYFEGETPPPSILEVDGADDIAIEFHSLSKPYAITGWRIGFAVGNADAVGILAKMKGTSDSGIWRGFQKAAAFALTSPECDTYIKENCKVYEANQAFMIDGFKKLGWPMDEFKPPRATFYFWIPIPRKYNSSVDFATDMLEKSGIVIVPGTAFGANGEGFVRLSLVNPREELQEVLNRMEADGFTY